MGNTETLTKSNADVKKSSPYILMLHNDDYNTFQWVIKCLITVCDHSQEQAEQCANIVHFKGECDVKYGDYETISTMKEKLENAGLSVTMELN
jgi:ATP-dependent Clp protease adaptor protein ClpS